MKNVLFILATLLASQTGFSHEGHDQTPGAMVAPHGGVTKGTDELYLELVSAGGKIKIYPLTHDAAPIALKQLKLTGAVTLPKKKKSEPVTFSQASDHFEAKVDSKGAHRYALELVVIYKGKKDKVKFQVEP